MPAPESRSTPVVSMSRTAVPDVIPVRSCARVSRSGPPAASSIKAPIAAACGAAAEVPQNVEKPGVAVDTHVAAVRSGFCSSFPPVEEKLPDVIAVPSGWKKIRRGPSELSVWTDSVPLKTLPDPAAVRTSTIATLTAFSAAAWPYRLPAVWIPNRPSKACTRR